MTGEVHGHPLHAVALQGFELLRRLGLVVRRVRHLGRGWPRRILIEGALKITGPGEIALAEGVRLNEGVWLHAEHGARLTIGTRTAIGRGSMITAMGEITLAQDVLLSPYVVVMDHSHGGRDGEGPYLHQPLRRRGSITIEQGCWLGAHVCILSGPANLVIGARSLIGAGAVVTSSVPADSVVHGPAARPRVPSTEGAGT